MIYIYTYIYIYITNNPILHIQFYFWQLNRIVIKIENLESNEMQWGKDHWITVPKHIFQNTTWGLCCTYPLVISHCWKFLHLKDVNFPIPRFILNTHTNPWGMYGMKLQIWDNGMEVFSRWSNIYPNGRFNFIFSYDLIRQMMSNDVRVPQIYIKNMSKSGWNSGSWTHLCLHPSQAPSSAQIGGL